MIGDGWWDGVGVSIPIQNSLDLHNQKPSPDRRSRPVPTMPMLPFFGSAPPAFLSARIKIEDKDKFLEYALTFGPAVKKFGGKIVVKTADLDVRESSQGAEGLLTVIEFPSIAKAKAFYKSPEYKLTQDMRACCSKCDLVIAEGRAAATPGAGKGFVITRVKVSNRGKLARMQDHLEPLVEMSKKRGGRILCKSPDPHVMESEQGAEGALIVIEFADASKARLFYESDEYQLHKAEREACSAADLVIATGITPPK